MFCVICKKENTKHYKYEGDFLCRDCFTIQLMIELQQLRKRLNSISGIHSKQIDNILGNVINMLNEYSQEINPSRRRQ